MHCILYKYICKTRFVEEQLLVRLTSKVPLRQIKFMLHKKNISNTWSYLKYTFLHSSFFLWIDCFVIQPKRWYMLKPNIHWLWAVNTELCPIVNTRASILSKTNEASVVCTMGIFFNTLRVVSVNIHVLSWMHQRKVGHYFAAFYKQFIS